MAVTASKSTVSGLAYLEHLAFSGGAGAAVDYLQDVLGTDHTTRLYSVIERGSDAGRIDVSPADEITYSSFDPPPSWNLPYSVQQVRFGTKPKQDYMYHEGEEILIPIAGAIQYHFFASKNGKIPTEITLPKPLKKSEIIRINPLIPHHTWAAGETEAKAWMIFRHPSGSDALVLNGAGPSTPRRRRTASQLQEPGQYALISWGISEMIRSARLRSGLTVDQLAKRVHASTSSLSRIEEARSNVSLELLQKICNTLHLSFTDQIIATQWHYQSRQIPASVSQEQSLPLLHEPIPKAHYLHPMFYSLAKGQNVHVQAAHGSLDSYATWLVLEGQVLFDLTNLKGRTVLIDRGTVVHLRSSKFVTIQALESSRLVQIRYSAGCTCEKRES
jgi:transcriptional regulator with XRE-family HTH domain